MDFHSDRIPNNKFLNLKNQAQNLLSEILEDIEIERVELNQEKDTLVVQFEQEGDQQRLNINEILEGYYEEIQNDEEEITSITVKYIKLIQNTLDMNHKTIIYESKDRLPTILTQIYNGQSRDKNNFFLFQTIESNPSAPRIFVLNNKLEYKQVMYNNVDRARLQQLNDLFRTLNFKMPIPQITNPNVYISSKVNTDPIIKVIPIAKIIPNDNINPNANIITNSIQIQKLNQLDQFIIEQLHKCINTYQAQDQQMKQQLLNKIQKFKTIIQEQQMFTMMKIKQIEQNAENVNNKKIEFLLIQSLDQYVQKIIEKEEQGLLNHEEILKQTDKIIYD